MSKIEDEVARKLKERAAIGKDKYGVTMERTDLSTLEWLTHAQEEAMDLSVYLQKLIELEHDRLEKRMNIIGQNGNDGEHYDDQTGLGYLKSTIK